MELTSTQTQAIEQGQAVPIAVDETECVILRKDVFDRVRHLIYDDSDLTSDEMQYLLAAIGHQAGWDEPEMDAYDDYDAERAKQCQ